MVDGVDKPRTVQEMALVITNLVSSLVEQGVADVSLELEGHRHSRKDDDVMTSPMELL